MPLWKVYHPEGAYTAQDKKAISEKVTALYTKIPIPGFYVVFVFEEYKKDSCYVGGESHPKFVRIKVDHIARTLPGPIFREWWMRNVEATIAPFVKDRGFDWEVSIDETPFDLWTLQGEIAPPFESIAEKRWCQENKASPYTLADKIPANAFILGHGVTG